MKYCSHLLTITLFVIASCNRPVTTDGAANTDNNKPKENPPPGTLVLTDTMDIEEDQLNDFKFSIAVTTTEHTGDKGTYSVETTWGNNIANTEFSMPRGEEQLKPLLRRGVEPYSYLIGFYYGDDTTFYDYYLVTAQRGQIAAKYTKAYNFQ